MPICDHVLIITSSGSTGGGGGQEGQDPPPPPLMGQHPISRDPTSPDLVHHQCKISYLKFLNKLILMLLFIYLFIYSYFAPRRGSNIQVQSVTERDKIIKTVKNKT